MTASSVVAAQERVKAAAAELVAGPGPGVGPFGEQGAVEPFGSQLVQGQPGLVNRRLSCQAVQTSPA